jgi:HSP20 family protein
VARRDIDRLQDEIEELFADLWQVPRFSGMRHGFRPQVDCFRTENPPRFTIVMELPGVDPDTFKVVAEGRNLVVSGERPRPLAPGQVYQQMEIEYGPFKRSIPLPPDADVAQASAEYQRGMLTLTVPIAERAAAPQPIVIVVQRVG